MFRKFFLAVFIILFITSYRTVQSQDSFSEIAFTVTGSHILGNNTFLKSWSPTNGIGLEISIPYYFGNLETGIRYMRYNELEFKGSGFHSSFIFAGWSYTHFLSEENDLSMVPALRLGSRYIVLDEEKTYGDEYHFSKFESELSFELQLRIQYRISKNLGFYVSAAHNRTLFYIPHSEWVGVAGLSVIFETSDRMKNFLK